MNSLNMSVEANQLNNSVNFQSKRLPSATGRTVRCGYFFGKVLQMKEIDESLILSEVEHVFIV